MCLQLEADENLCRQIYLSGLPPKYKHCVIMNECKTPYEIEHSARLSEMTERYDAQDPRLQTTSTPEQRTETTSADVPKPDDKQTVTQELSEKLTECADLLRDIRSQQESQGRCDRFIGQSTNIEKCSYTQGYRKHNQGRQPNPKWLPSTRYHGNCIGAYKLGNHEKKQKHVQKSEKKQPVIWENKGRSPTYNLDQNRGSRVTRENKGRQFTQKADKEEMSRLPKSKVDQDKAYRDGSKDTYLTTKHQNIRDKMQENNQREVRGHSTLNKENVDRRVRLGDRVQTVGHNKGRQLAQTINTKEISDEKQKDKDKLISEITHGKYLREEKDVLGSQENTETQASLGEGISHFAEGQDSEQIWSNSIIKIRVGKHVTDTLTDSGASISCITNATVRKSGLTDKHPIEPAIIKAITGVGGTSSQVIGQITLPIEIGGLAIHHRFHVIEKLSHSVILGQDFLSIQKAQIDFDHNVLRLQDGIVEVPMGVKETWTRSKLVRLVGNITVPPRSEMIVPIQTKPGPAKKQTGIIESSATLPSHVGIKGARCFVELASHKSAYRVLNPTNAHIELKDKQILGRFVPVPEEDIIGYLDDSSENSEAVSALDKDPHEDEHYIKLAKEMEIDLSTSDLSDDERRKLLILLGRNRDIFAKDLSELGSCTEGNYMHRIDTGDAHPVKRRFFRASPKTKEEISKKIDEMLKGGVIEPASTEWLSPVVMVKKADGDLRFCVDFRALNAVSRPLHFPLPRLEEIIDTLAESEAKIYSKLDLLSGYWQIKLDPETKHKTGFITHKGVHQFTKLPFGLQGAPASFQMIMTQVLRDMTWKFALVYVDDILIFSKDFNEHIEHLTAVFQRLREANLKLKPSKCHFAAEEVQYLGHVLSKKGIAVDTKKTDAVQSFPRPKNVHDLRAFIGLANYYRRFVHNFAKKAAPLNKLLKKETKFTWSEECEEAFIDLKTALVSPPILSFPDFNREFIVYTDASDTAVGYILGQRDTDGREVVIAYGGRSLQRSEHNWAITEKECLALIEAVKNFHVYLTGSRFKVYTDHIALTYLNSMKQKNGRLLRWAMFLQQYNMDIVHKPGRVHQNADGLSRRAYQEDNSEKREESGDQKVIHTPEVKESESTFEKLAEAESAYLATSPVQVIQEVLALTEENIKASQRADTQFAPYIKFLEEDILPEDRKLASRIRDEQLSYQMTDGVLYHLYSPRGKGPKGDREVLQLCVPHVYRDDILRSYHDRLGHQGQDRTQRAIALKYFWPRMQSDIEKYVKSCLECQQSKQYFHHKRAPLQPIPVRDIFSRIHVDILGPLNESHDGYTHILLVVCSFSKWVEAFPMRSTHSSEIARILHSEIFCRYGSPTEIVSDRGANFCSKLIQGVCKLFQITKKQTSSYHPQTNSACERMNRTIGQTLRAYCDEDQKNWPEVLPSVLQAYRMTPATESTGFSPFYMVFLRDPTLPIDVSLLPTPNIGKEATKHLEKLKEDAERVRDIARDNIKAAQMKYAHQHDKRAEPPKFQVEQRVWLYCKKTKKGQSAKLCRKWLGPYYICMAFNNITYKLRRLSDHKPVKSVVHADRLRPYFDPADRPTNSPDIPAQEAEDLNPEEIQEEENDDSQQSQPASQDGTQDNADQQTQESNTPDAESQNTQPEQATKPFSRDEVTAIKSAKKYGPAYWYQVKLRDETRLRSVREDLLPADLIRHFHATKTQKGHARKKKQRGEEETK